jgi:hypothetical protein
MLPEPAAGFAEGGQLVVEIATQAAAGLQMVIGGAQLVLWTDSTAQNHQQVGNDARALVARSMRGAVNSSGTYIERPAQLAQHLLEMAGLSSLVDAASFAAALAYEVANGVGCAGIIPSQEPVGSILARLAHSAGCVYLWRDGAFTVWRWPETAAPQWQFASAVRGPSNVLPGSVGYSRTPFDSLVGACSLLYAPRSFTSERRMVQGPVRKPPARGGAAVGGRPRYSLDYPFQIGEAAEAASWQTYTYGTLPERAPFTADFVADDVHAAWLLGLWQTIHGRQRWIVRFTCGPEGLLVPLGSLGEWIDDRLPWPVLRAIDSLAWWGWPVGDDDKWPAQTRGFYSICIGKRRISENEYEITLLEWSNPAHPDRG